MKAYMIAEMILDCFKDADWYEYRDMVGEFGQYERDEDFELAVAQELRDGKTQYHLDGVREWLERAEQVEDYDLANRIRYLMNEIREYECEIGITH
mgnify:CR=1 FL=1